MKRASLITLAALATALTSGPAVVPAAAAPQAAASAPAPTAPPIKVMPLGDSITDGAGSTSGAGYRAPLWDLTAQQSSYTVDLVGTNSSGSVADPDHEGHSGYRIAQVRADIDRWLSAADPDVVLLHLGINDLKWDPAADPVQSAHQLSELVDRIFADKPGVTVVVQGLLTATPGLEQRTARFNREFAALQEQGQSTAGGPAGRHLRYVDPANLDAATDLPDQLHPNDNGYRKMAEVFHRALDQVVADGWASRPTAPRAGTEAGGSGRVRWADFDGDGKPDYLTVEDSGAVKVWLNRGGDQAGAGGWQSVGQIATGVTNDRTRVRFADFDGDGKADYIVINPDGSVNVWLNRGGDQAGGWQGIGQVAAGVTNRQEQVRFADFDGDGRSDYLVIEDNGTVKVWLNRGGDQAGADGWYGIGQIATGVTNDRTRVRLADLDGDGKADYLLINPDGSVNAWLNRGGDRHGGWLPIGRIATGVTDRQELVTFVDFDGDTHADYLRTETGGAVTAYAYRGGDSAGAGGWAGLGQIAGGA
ncbi:FG-GAP-like repeat-containing protein [Kitasatospora sp. NPDC057940]|uniref:FG-GAP-like repeat-containing protein n=1 Tax=Kitasatospora sp. NPDC057940 TaxID=3346285 RepID=UPI0036DC1358